MENNYDAHGQVMCSTVQTREREYFTVWDRRWHFLEAVELNTWCKNTFGEPCEHHVREGRYYITLSNKFVFRDEADCVMFLLRWT